MSLVVLAIWSAVIIGMAADHIKHQPHDTTPALFIAIVVIFASAVLMGGSSL
jgi:hypothetical protein